MSTMALPRLADRFWNPDTPIHFDEELESWCVYSYADVHKVVTKVRPVSTSGSSRSFSASYGIPVKDLPKHRPPTAGMWAADDRRHDDLRALTADVFRPIAVHELAEQIRTIVVDLINSALEASPGRIEIVSALTMKLPSLVACKMLDVDFTYAEMAKRWNDEINDFGAMEKLPPQPDQAEAIRHLIAERRKKSGNGLIDDLIRAQNAGYSVDGRAFSDWDLIGYIALLLVGGDTTNGGLGNAILYLSEYGHLNELRDDPGLIGSAIDESLRWYPPFPGVRRRAVVDVKFGERTIAAGSFVMGWLTAANRDPVRFPHPHVFDIRRKPNRHLSFGIGAHHCLGAPLARLEMQIALEEISLRLPGLQRDPTVRLERPAHIVTSLKAASFTYDADAADAVRSRDEQV